MSTYRRQGHFRRGPNGQPVWVQPHDVTRSGSSTNSYTPSPRPTIRISNAAVPSVPKISRPKSTLWVEPNARCPVCGAAVYFYKNEAGSRVYFDEIGPPWPKHPCIDMPFYTRPSAEFQGTPVVPSLREPTPRSGKTSRRKPQRLHDDARSGSTHVFQAFTVQGSEEGADKALLYLRALAEEGSVGLCEVSGVTVPQLGQLVFVSDTWISYFDVARMSVVQSQSTLITEPTPAPTPGPKESIVASEPPRKITASTPLTLRKYPVSTEPRKGTASEARVRAEGDSQESAGCGFSLLLFFLIILLWLVFGFWPGDHSFFGVLGGLVMSLITALGFTFGFTLMANAKKEAAHERRQRPQDRPQNLPAGPIGLRDPYSLFREE